jgi:hypothetical protein
VRLGGSSPTGVFGEVPRSDFIGAGEFLKSFGRVSPDGLEQPVPVPLDVKERPFPEAVEPGFGLGDRQT